MPKVSIVMTTYRRPQQLNNTLQSIRSQSYKDYEVIVVDDGMEEDGTCEIALKYDTHYLRVGRKQAGYKNPARPINIGVKLAAGDIVILQNAECRHKSKEVIECLSSLVTENNVVFAQVMSLDESGANKQWYCHPTLFPRPFFFCGAIRKEWFYKLGGFDEDFIAYGYEDDDFANRLRQAGVRFKFTNIEVDHQWHPNFMGLNSGQNTEQLFVQKLNAGVVRNQNRIWGAM